MKIMKKLLAVLMAIFMLCGVVAIGASAIELCPYQPGFRPASYCECFGCRSDRAFQEMKAQLQRMREYWENAWRNGYMKGNEQFAFEYAVKNGEAIIEDRNEYVFIINGSWSKTQYEPMILLRTEELSLEAIKKSSNQEFAEKYLTMADLDKEFAPQLKAAGVSSMSSLISIAATERISIISIYRPFIIRPNCGCSCHYFGGPIHVQPCCNPYQFQLGTQTGRFITDKEARPYFEAITADGLVTIAADDTIMKQLEADGIKLQPETAYESNAKFVADKAGEVTLSDVKLQVEKADLKQVEEAVQKAPANRATSRISITISSRLMRDKDGNWYRVTIIYFGNEAISVMVLKYG